jgi:hypothetical protein
MVENHADVAYDLMEVEAELCRLPDVSGVRIVADDLGRPIEVHVLAHTGKQPKQIVRDIQSVALASFGLELDRRIVSVVQLGPNGSVQTASPEQMLERTQIVSVQTNVEGRRTAVQVVLRAGEREATGFAEGYTRCPRSALRQRAVFGDGSRGGDPRP